MENIIKKIPNIDEDRITRLTKKYDFPKNNLINTYKIYLSDKKNVIKDEGRYIFHLSKLKLNQVYKNIAYKNITLHGDWDYAVLFSHSIEIERIYKENVINFTCSLDFLPQSIYYNYEIKIYGGINTYITFDLVSVDYDNNHLYFPYTTIDYNFYRMRMNNLESITLISYLPITEINIKTNYNKKIKIFFIIDNFESIIPFKYKKEEKVWSLKCHNFEYNDNLRCKIFILNNNKKDYYIYCDTYVKYRNLAVYNIDFYYCSYVL